MESSRKSKIIALSVMTALLVVTIIVTYLSTAEFARNGWLFENKNNSYLPWNQRGSITDSGLTPARFAFTAWAVIYVYQAAMLAYSWSLMFRRDPMTSEYLCCTRGLLPLSAMWLHSASSVCNSAWSFLADRVDSSPGFLVPQTLALFLLLAGVAGAIGVAYYGLGIAYEQEGTTNKERLLFAGLWLNANGLYVGWLFVASFLNLDIAIINLGHWPVVQSSNLTLAHLSVLAAVYVVLDLFYLKLHLLHTPYLTAIWALATSASRNFSATSATAVFSIELAVGLVVVLIIKFVLLVRSLNEGAVTPVRKLSSDRIIMSEVASAKHLG